MARYTKESVERVRDAVDFVDLVGSRTELRRSGTNQLEGLCPFHDERTPSFGIDPVKKLFHCFGCGEGGSEVDFVMKLEGLDFKSTIEYLADRYNIELELEDEDPAAAQRRQRRERLLELLERTASFYERVLWQSPQAEIARAYLLERGLTEESLRTFRVGYAPSGWDTVLRASQQAGYSQRELFDVGLARAGRDGRGAYDQFRERITFPLADSRGRVIGFGARQMTKDRGPKYLNTPENELFHKGRIVYGAHLARAAAAKAGAVIVTEGYTDVIALAQAGFPNAVCIMGTSMTEEQVKVLRRLAPTAQLALDPDAAGQEAMLRAAKIASGEDLKLRVVGLPEGNDPADLVMREGPERMASILEASTPFARFRILRILKKGDPRSAEGKEEILEEMKPTFAALPEIAAGRLMRDELVGIISNRLDLHADVVMQQLAKPQRARPASRPEPRRRPPAPPPAHAPARPRQRPAPVPATAPAGAVAAPTSFRDPGDDRPPFEDPGFADPGDDRPPLEDPGFHDPGPEDDGRYGGGFTPPGQRAPRSELAGILAREEEVERRFLAFCVAMPEAGAESLARVDPKEHFTSPLMHRAAEHLRSNLTNPMETLPPDDEELTALMRELTVRAGREPASTATLDAQRLQLELRRLDRRLAAIRASGEGGATDLAVRRQEVKNELDQAMVRAVESD